MTSASPPTFWQNNVTLGVEPYIGCPCPWVLGGHRCDIIVHGWPWLSTCHAMGGMGGGRLLLMGVVWVWVQIRRKCWALIRSFFVFSERSLPDLIDTLWCALVVIDNFELDFTFKNTQVSYSLFIFYIAILFWFSPIFLIISHYAQNVTLSNIYVTPCLYDSFWSNRWCDIIKVRL